MFQFEGSRARRILIYSRESQPLGCIQAFDWWDEAHTHWGGQSALLGLPSQTWISSQSTGTLKIMFNQIPGHPVAQSNWHIKLAITHSMSKSWTPDLLDRSYSSHPFPHHWSSTASFWLGSSQNPYSYSWLSHLTYNLLETLFTLETYPEFNHSLPLSLLPP